MVKRCAWGQCKSDSRYPERLAGGVEFFPFVKPRRNLERCLRWIIACGRPPHKLNVEKVDYNHHLYVCSKHFVDGEPSERHPDPVPACPDEEPSQSAQQPAPRDRPAAEPVQESRLTAADVPGASDSTVLDHPIKVERPDTPADPSADGAGQAEEEEKEEHLKMDGGASTSGQTLRLLALTAENTSLREELEKTRAEVDRLRNDLATQVQNNQVLQKQVEDANQTSVNTELLQARMLFFHNQMMTSFKQYTGVDYHEFLKFYMSWCQNQASKK